MQAMVFLKAQPAIQQEIEKTVKSSQTGSAEAKTIQAEKPAAANLPPPSPLLRQASLGPSLKGYKAEEVETNLFSFITTKPAPTLTAAQQMVKEHFGAETTK